MTAAVVLLIGFIHFIVQFVFGEIDFSEFDNQIYLDNDEQYLVAWSMDATKTNITIGLSVPTSGWGAFGISEGLMTNADIALFWVDDTTGAVFLQDRYTENERVTPQLDTSQNLILIEGEQIYEKTNIIFQRSVIPCDEDHDNPIVIGTTKVIFAYDDNNEDPIITSYNAERPELSIISFGWHGLNRGSRSVNLYHGLQFNTELEPDAQYYDITMKNYSVPSVRTTYTAISAVLPIEPDERFHVVKIGAIITPGNEMHVKLKLNMYCCLLLQNSP